MVLAMVAACEGEPIDRNAHTTTTGAGTTGTGGSAGGTTTSSGGDVTQPPPPGAECADPVELIVDGGPETAGGWFSVTPAVSGCYRIVTDAGPGGVSHHVYEGLDCDPHGPTLWESEMGHNAVSTEGPLEQGSSYLIWAWAQMSATLDGSVSLLSAELGNSCQTPYDLSAASFPATIPGGFACESLVEDPCIAYNVAWFSYVPVSTAPYGITVVNAGDVDTAHLAVFEGDGCSPLGTQIACGERPGSITGTTATLTNGASYRIAFSVTPDSAPTEDLEVTVAVLQPVYEESFDGVCPNGWTLSGDWQCGTPSAVGPTTAYSGAQCLGTVLDGNYSNGQAYGTATAATPSIDLTGLRAARATWRTWIQLPDGSDTYRLEVSVDDGATWQRVASVTPEYDFYSGWTGDQHLAGWQSFTAELSAYAGQSIALRFVFESDSTAAYPGVYLDDFTVGGS